MSFHSYNPAHLLWNVLYITPGLEIENESTQI